MLWMRTVPSRVVSSEDNFEENSMHSLLDLALAGQLHRDRSSVTLSRSHLRLRSWLTRAPDGTA